MAGGAGKIIRIAIDFLKKVRKRQKNAPHAPTTPHTPSLGFPPASARSRVPSAWGTGNPNKKGVGNRWTDPSNPGNGVRIDQGSPHSQWPTQQVDHVVVRRDGQVIGRDGNPITGSVKSDPHNAHIPLSDWMGWSSWDRP
jgi:hypothetical protein